MLKSVETSTKYALSAIQDNTYKAGVVVLDMKADGVNFSEKNTELGADIIKKVNDIKQDIINGKIKVYATYKDALAANAVPAGLSAIDD